MKGNMNMDEEWYQDENDNKIWWLDTGNRKGYFIFSFDKKKRYNLFEDYPHNMTPEEVEIFDKENPFWANFFKKRSRNA